MIVAGLVFRVHQDAWPRCPQRSRDKPGDGFVSSLRPLNITCDSNHKPCIDPPQHLHTD